MTAMVAPVVKLLALSAAGAVVSLDRRAVLQGMVSRPIVAAILIGALGGRPQIGLAVGIAVELLWIDRIAVGAYVPPDDTAVAAAMTVSLVTAFPALTIGTSLHLFSVAALICLPAAYLGQFAETAIRRLAVPPSIVDPAKGVGALITGIERQVVKNLFYYLLSYFVIIAAVSGVSYLVLTTAAPIVSPRLRHALGLGFLAVPLVGVGNALSIYRNIPTKKFFLGGAALGVMLAATAFIV